MRKVLLSVWLIMALQSGFSQSNSFYSIESEYTTTFGYRYFFDKTDPATGISTQLSQLPISGYYVGSKFFNCYGNYVFCGVDSSTTSAPFLFKFFEIDTLGNIVRTLPMTSASGNGPDIIHFNRSYDSPMYYGIMMTGFDNRTYVSIDPLTGATTIVASQSLPLHTASPVSVMGPGNNFYFIEQNNMTGNRVLYKADATSGTIYATDSAVSSNDITNLAYDCVQDSIVGFHCPFPYNVNGAEWIKVNNLNGKIRHTGTVFSSGSGGTLYSTGFTLLNGGDFYAKTYSNAGILFDPALVTGPSFTPLSTYLNPLDLKLISSPELHCTNYYSCTALSLNEQAEQNFAVSVYPNPFNNNTTFFVEVNGSATYSFELTDVLGKKVRVINGISHKQFDISRSGLEDGIYFYRIYNSEIIIGAGKVIIK